MNDISENLYSSLFFSASHLHDIEDILNNDLIIEEFRIIGFYLYHVTSIRPSNSIGASGSFTVSLYIDYDRGSTSYYC